MSDRLSTAEVAKATGIPEPTIKHWLGKLPIPAEKDSAGRWRFDEEALEVLKAVKDLRDQDRTFETIRRRIGEPELSAESSGLSDRLSPDNLQPTTDERASSVDERMLAESLAGVIAPQLIDALAAQNELAEKYARATYTIGQLEERVSNLTVQLAETKQRLLLLDAPREEVRAPRPWWKLWG